MFRTSTCWSATITSGEDCRSGASNSSAQEPRSMRKVGYSELQLPYNWLGAVVPTMC
jgi:hypothetical protein